MYVIYFESLLSIFLNLFPFKFCNVRLEKFCSTMAAKIILEYTLHLFLLTIIDRDNINIKENITFLIGE